MKWIVTGGAGFIGTNLVGYLIESGHAVVVVDDLSRHGVDANARFLREHYDVKSHQVDVSDMTALDAFLREQGCFDAVAHLAGQVSLMESIRNPRRDFEVNALGTFNVLECVRLQAPEAAVIGMSSNKAYGDLRHVEIVEQERRYVAPQWPMGFDESLPLDFHGPYGCSKGIADQYLADYARTFGLRTASLRQSSVYGPHQHPRADQGWVAHLTTEAVAGNAIELNGVGKQVRDLLHAADLARLLVALADCLQPYEINQFNVGGGPANALSILELFDWLQERLGRPVYHRTGQERPSDQRVFVSDNSRVHGKTGWEPEISLDQGLLALLGQALDDLPC